MAEVITGEAVVIEVPCARFPSRARAQARMLAQTVPGDQPAGGQQAGGPPGGPQPSDEQPGSQQPGVPAAQPGGFLPPR